MTDVLHCKVNFFQARRRNARRRRRSESLVRTLLADWVEMVRRPRLWGVRGTDDEREYPCDGLLRRADDTYVRACSVEAPPSRLFRWLCQLRVAPYSYDWIDNLGRPSSPRLTEGLENLAVGQRFMTIFGLAAFEVDRHVTLVLIPFAARLFGDIALTYAVEPRGTGARFIARLRIRYPRGPVGWLLRRVLPLADAIMMRKQMLNLKALAEGVR